MYTCLFANVLGEFFLLRLSILGWEWDKHLPDLLIGKPEG